MPDIVTKKSVVNSKNFPDGHKETGDPILEKVENRINADKGTPDDIVPAENRIKANSKEQPDMHQETDNR